MMTSHEQLHPGGMDMGRLSTRFDSSGSRSRSHSRSSRSTSPATAHQSQVAESEECGARKSIANGEEREKPKCDGGKGAQTHESKKSKKQQSNNNSSSSKKQQKQQQQQQISHGLKAEGVATSNSVIREEENSSELEAENGGGGSTGKKRGQQPQPTSNDRRSRTVSSSSTTAKSKKFFDQWKQAASMSKLGNRTKNLLGKWKSHSQSVDIVIGGTNTTNSGFATPGAIQGSDTARITQDSLGAHHGVMGSDPGSTDGHTFGLDKQDQQQQPIKAKAQWSEHVWTAWVHRGFSDDVTEVNTIQPGADLITDFQKDKFRHFFFHVLDLNSDCVISAEDFEKLNERIRHYMDWSVNSIQYLALKEVHLTFLECFLNLASNFAKKNDEFDYWDPFKRLDALYDKMLQDRGDVIAVINGVKDVEAPGKTCVSIDEWVDVWGILVGKAKKMDDFPMWLQYYPKVLFDVINRSGTGVITKSELKYFYTAFMDVGKLGESRLDEITTNAYRAMTSDGDVRLTYHIYKLSFLNFLLGKQPNGPGQYIFGTVQPAQPYCMFPIDYSALNASEEDIEPFRHEKLEEKGSRRSVIV